MVFKIKTEPKKIKIFLIIKNLSFFNPTLNTVNNPIVKYIAISIIHLNITEYVLFVRFSRNAQDE